MQTSIGSSIDYVPVDRSADYVKAAAACLPALTLAYSAIVDPLVNFGLGSGVEIGGLLLGAETKNTFLARVFLPACLAAATVLALLSRPQIPRAMFPILLSGAAYLMLAGASAIWSADPMGTLTFAVYLTILYLTLFLSITVAADPSKILAWLLGLFALVVMINLLAILLTPPSPIGHSGIYDHKNTLGAAAGCALLFGMFARPKPTIFWRLTGLFTVVGSLLLIFVSDSKTALALAVIAPLVAIGFYLARSLVGIGPLLFLFLLAGFVTTGFIVFGQFLGISTNDLLFAIYGDTTFTGRTEIWAFAIGFIREAPFFGHGLRGFWGLGLDSPKHLSNIDFIRTIGSSHNGFIDVALDLGLFGLALVVLILIFTLRAIGAIHIRPARHTILYFALLVFSFGRNMMESVIMWSSFFDNLLFITIGFSACLASSQVRHLHA